MLLLITQPTSGGSNSIIVCHDMVMMFGYPSWAVVTMTTGPGSSKLYTLDRGKDFLAILIPPFRQWLTPNFVGLKA